MGLLKQEERHVLSDLLSKLPHVAYPSVRNQLLSGIPQELQVQIISIGASKPDLLSMVNAVDDENWDEPYQGSWPVLQLIQNAIFHVGKASPLGQKLQALLDVLSMRAEQRGTPSTLSKEDNKDLPNKHADEHKTEMEKSSTLKAQTSSSTAVSKPSRTSTFISYSHKDKRYLDELHVHLAQYVRMGIVDSWDDTNIAAGAKWHEEIKKALQRAKVAVLLISADFLASDFIATNELPPLLAAAKQEGTVILPIILSPCVFKDTELAQFQSVNAPSNPLSKMTRYRREETWTQVAELIKNALQLPN